MKLAETYANNCSIDKIGRPDLPTQYFPLPVDKYITIQNSSGMPAKDYSLWQDVVNLIHPYLEKEGISIVQIGRGEIQPLNRTINLLNQTNFAQTVYLLHNSLLHCGNDSFASHACGDTTPCIIVFGSTSAQCHAPAVTHPQSIFTESHRNGNNPSYQAQEQPKSINKIPVEKVAADILKVLGISHQINQKTILVGDQYPQIVIEIVPDGIVNPQSLPPGAINLRADLFFDLNNIIQNLQLRQYVLSLNQQIDINILKQLKPNIPLLIYEIDEETDVDYLLSIVRAGIQLQLTTKVDEETLKGLKLKYLDLPLIVRRVDTPLSQVLEQIKSYNNIDNLNKIELDKPLRYQSSRLLLSNNKQYLSLADWKLDRPVENMECSSVADLDNQDFLNEVNYFRIYETIEV